ncbi:MAG: hypothetical protein ABIP63_09060 [Thermoanaerobaculia bacterium]
MSMTIRNPDCPSEETLAAFVDRRLVVSERAGIVRHIAGCAQCHAFAVAAPDRTGPADAASTSALPFRPRIILALAVLAAAVAASIFLAIPLADRLHGNTGVDALARSVPERRPIEARLTGFDYHPMSPAIPRTGEGSSDDDARNWRLLNVASRIQESATRNPTVENLHVLGVSRLLLGQTGAAVKALEQALLAETAQSDADLALDASGNAALLNDLAAALATDSSRTGNAAEGERALRAAERSWNLGKAPEAAWNRAVALEAARGRKKSVEAWKNYLTVDTSSPWAAEAQARVQSVSTD